MAEDRNLDEYIDKAAPAVVPVVVERAQEGGFSLRPFAEVDEPTRGTMVSLPNSAGLNLTLELASLTEDVLREKLLPWLKAALRYLVTHGDTYIGGWYDPEGGKLYYDVSERYDDHERAVKLGRERNQITVYRIDEGKLYSTGGTGE